MHADSAWCLPHFLLLMASSVVVPSPSRASWGSGWPPLQRSCTWVPGEDGMLLDGNTDFWLYRADFCGLNASNSLSWMHAAAELSVLDVSNRARGLLHAFAASAAEVRRWARMGQGMWRMGSVTGLWQSVGWDPSQPRPWERLLYNLAADCLPLRADSAGKVERRGAATFHGARPHLLHPWLRLLPQPGVFEEAGQRHRGMGLELAVWYAEYMLGCKCQEYGIRVVRGGGTVGGKWLRIQSGGYLQVLMGYKLEVVGDGDGDGDGVVRRQQAVWEYAHRVLAWLHSGPQQDSGHVAMHLCNNPRCLLLYHVVWGSRSENRRGCLRTTTESTLPGTRGPGSPFTYPWGRALSVVRERARLRREQQRAVIAAASGGGTAAVGGGG